MTQGRCAKIPHEIIPTLAKSIKAERYKGTQLTSLEMSEADLSEETGASSRREKILFYCSKHFDSQKQGVSQT